MKESIWRPAWWVFLPAAFPCLAFLWLRLGEWLHLPLVIAPQAGPAPSYPWWLTMGYYGVQRGLWIFLSPGALMALWLHGVGALPDGIFWAGILFSVVVEGLFLYGLLVMTRWSTRRTDVTS